MDRSIVESVQAGVAARFVRCRELLGGMRAALRPAFRSADSFRPEKSHEPSPGAPRVLLLTSSLGSGHVAAARAIERALRDRIPTASVGVLDFWSLTDSVVSDSVRSAYLRLVQEHPDLYDDLYRLDQRLWRDLLDSDRSPPPALKAGFEFFADVCAERLDAPARGERHATDRLLLRLLCSSVPGRRRGAPVNHALLRMALLKWSWMRLADRLGSRVRAFAPDVVVVTQMNPAALLGTLRRRRGLRIPAVGVPTDFGLHDFWLGGGIDLYCVAHETIDNIDSLAPDRFAITGLPLMPGFRKPPSAGAARARLGLAPDRPVVLVQGGGLGLGVDAVARRLLATHADMQLVALSGQNEAARIALSALATDHRSRLQVHAWAEHMEVLIRAADIVVGKPGGLTVAEALACGRPMFATRSLRGQEGFNVRFLERHDVGSLLPEDELVPRIVSLLADRAKLLGMQRRAEALGRRDGAARIVDQVLAFAGSKVSPAEAR